MHTDTIIIVVAIFVLILLWELVKKLFRKPRNYREEFRFPNPVGVLHNDLGRALYHVKEQLSKDWKGSAFPIKMSLPSGMSHVSWTPETEILPIIAGLLELEGWVITRNETCVGSEFFVDLPRKKF